MQIVFEEPLISENRKPQLRRLIYKLIEKLESNEDTSFYLFKILRAHILPLTNCAFNKSGDKFITGSYDRTCKVRFPQVDAHSWGLLIYIEESTALIHVTRCGTL